MYTPRKKSTLIILSVCYWMAAPIVEIIFYVTKQSRNMYSSDSDIIAIPILQFIIIWLIASPFVVLFVRWALKFYSSKVPFLSFNHQHPFLGAIFWILTFICLVFNFISVMNNAHNRQFVDVFYEILGCYIALCFNGTIQTRY